VSKVELQAFRGKVRDLEVSPEKWREQAEKSGRLRQDLAQQLESVQAKNKQLEERLTALDAKKSPHCWPRTNAFPAAARSGIFTGETEVLRR